jgi:hypothetical protein
MELDVASDLSVIVDGAEVVTLRRRGSIATITVSAAWRANVRDREAEPSGGAVVQADAQWQLQLAGSERPQVGDVVIDGAGRHWTVLVVQHLPRLSRWKCEARELRIAYGCGERVDVERPVWSEGETPEIVGWTYLATALPVRIQPVEFSLDAENNPQAVFRVIVGEPLDLAAQDRLTAGDGTTYSVRSFEQAERIDALPVAVVRRE